MKNRDKYAEEILNVACTGKKIGKVIENLKKLEVVDEY